MQRRSRRGNSQQNQKRFARQMRARRPTKRAQRAVRDNRTRDRRSRRAGYRQEQFSETVAESSTPVPREIGRFLSVADEEAAEESHRRARWDQPPTAEKRRPRERNHARISLVAAPPDKCRACTKVNGKCKRKFRLEAKCPDVAGDR